MKKLIILVTIFALILYYLVGSYAYFEYIKPSYIGAVIPCHVRSLEEQNKIYANYGYRVAGFYNSDKDEIKVVEYKNQTDVQGTAKPIEEQQDVDIGTLKHELIHRNQAKRGMDISCRDINSRFLSEVEAYLGQNLNDKIYEIRYGKIN
jgi:hypothetical protein